MTPNFRVRFVLKTEDDESDEYVQDVTANNPAEAATAVRKQHTGAIILKTKLLREHH